MDKNIEFDISKVYLKFSEIHGRGVFAKNAIMPGTIIETFPLTPASFRSFYQGDIIVLQYGFVNKSCKCEECRRHGNVIYIASGYANMYNHQTPPKNNAKFNLDYAKLCGQVEAIALIEKDQEIIVDYGPEYAFRDGEITNHENPPR